MGKGDKKSKRGKIIMGSHGVARPRKIRKAKPPLAVVAPEPKPEEPKTKAKAAPKALVKDAEPKPKAVKKTKAAAKADDAAEPVS